MNIKIKSENQTLSANLIKSSETKNQPALIFIHGWKSDKTGNTKRALEISKLGIICLCLDLRGHGESDGTIDQFSRNDHLEDIKSAYEHLAKLPEVDKQKIGTVGSSYGGYLSAVATNYLKFNRLVLRVPALYFDNNMDVPTDKLINGDPKAFKSDDLTPEESLALKGVSEFKGKILLIESEKDIVIPHPVIENYLKFAGKDNLTYKIMKDAPHSLETDEQEKEYIEILSGWLSE